MFFAVAKLGDAPQDGKTDTNPEGLTAAQVQLLNPKSRLLRLKCQAFESSTNIGEISHVLLLALISHQI